MQTTLKLKALRNRSENREYRRESLIRGAICAVAHYDISGATVDLICRHAGVSRGLIPHYFDNKEHLLMAACESLFVKATSIKNEIVADTSLGNREKLCKLAQSSFLPPIYDIEEMAAWQAFTNASRSNSVFLGVIQVASTDLQGIFAPIFKAAAKESNTNLDPEAAAYGMVVLLDGLWSSLTTGKDDSTVDRAISVCNFYIDGLLGDN